MTVMRWIGCFVLALVVVGAGAWMIFAMPQRPSVAREWDGDQKRLARAEFGGDDTVTIRDMRDFTYTSASTYIPAYRDFRVALGDLESVWFVLTPFSTVWRGPAHALVSFGFKGGEHIAISVEARREVGESYSVVAGVFRRFEVVYIVGTERDLVGRRALYDGGDVYLYPVATPLTRARQMFVEMLQRANALQDHPEFYNTVTNNCTSNLVDHVNRMIPGRIPPTWRTVLPGYADALALSLGLIDAAGSLDEVRTQFRINDRAKQVKPNEDFSAAIREGMPRSPHQVAARHGPSRRLKGWERSGDSGAP